MILEDILTETRRAVQEAKRQRPRSVLEREAQAAPTPRPFAKALRTQSVAAIAEFKRRSPSAGWIRQDADPVAIGRAYQAAGAAAISVLTDGPFFGGSLEDLRRMRAAVRIPVLRKDFTVDPYQVIEARASGADAVLLIVAALSDGELDNLTNEAKRWGLDCLVEAHNAAEVERALACGAEVIGINHRDLHTFAVNMDLAVSLREHIPIGRVVVAESGLRTAEDVGRMRRAGIDAILVGENLMRAPDPGAALAALLREA